MLELKNWYTSCESRKASLGKICLHSFTLRIQTELPLTILCEQTTQLFLFQLFNFIFDCFVQRLEELQRIWIQQQGDIWNRPSDIVLGKQLSRLLHDCLRFLERVLPLHIMHSNKPCSLENRMLFSDCQQLCFQIRSRLLLLQNHARHKTRTFTHSARFAAISFFNLDCSCLSWRNKFTWEDYIELLEWNVRIR